VTETGGFMKTSNGQLSTVVEHLRRNRFNVSFAENANVAKDKVLEEIPFDATISVANSVTIRQIGVLEALQKRGNTVIDPISPGYGLVEFKQDTFIDTLKGTIDTDVFLSGTNAVTEDGKLVNIDGLGNRVAGMIWLLRKSIVVVGRNKIVKDVDEAIDRIKNTITPTFAKRRKLQLPCAKAGRCVDCNVPERACNITVVVEKKPSLTDLTVVVVDEDLGLGWNPEWSKERIDEIRHKYEQFDWPYAPAFLSYKSKFRIHHQ
jgi:hypothetical protein